MGLSYTETLDLPLSTLLDMISIQQIKTEGYRYKSTGRDGGPNEIFEMYKTLK